MTAKMLAFVTDKLPTLPIQDPVLGFAVLMLLILISPLIAQRLRGPGIVGLILAGVVVGPNALGVLERNQTIVMLGTAGLLYIMFTAGLEIDLFRFKKYRTHSLVFGFATFLIPQVLGTVMALWFLGFEWAGAILLASMFASHTLVPYPIVSRMGLSKSRAVTTAIGGTIITDTIALLVLVIVAASTRGELNTGFYLQLTVSLLAFTAVVWWGLPWLARWFFNTIPSEGVTHFVFIIASVYLCAHLAELAGAEGIIGAFLAGLALNRLVPEQSVMMARLEFAGNWFFIPIFLISVGMLVDPKLLLGDWEAWKISLAMVVTVMATKFLAASVSSKLLGYDAVESRVLFGLSVNQAAATLAAVIVGVRLGIFGDAVLNGSILMILVTCLVGPWFSERYGRLLAQKEQVAPDDELEQQPRILIPLRNPGGAESILDVAFMIRPKDTTEPIFPLTVVQDVEGSSRQLAMTERMLGKAVVHSVAGNIPVTPTVRLDTNPADGITRAARELRVSTIVMGWTGISPTRSMIFGSVLDQLLERAPQQLLVCRLTRELNTTERLILIVPPFADREPGFKQAIYTVKTLAQRMGLGIALSCDAEHAAHLGRRIAAVASEVPTDAFELTNLDHWRNPDPAVLRRTDLVVLISARREQASWQPALERIPQQLVALTPPLNLIVIYGGITDSDPLLGPEPAPLHRLFHPRRLIPAIDADDLRSLIQRLVDAEFLSQPDRSAQLSDELLESVSSKPILIAPETLFLHAHSHQIDAPIAFLATLVSGSRLTVAADPVRCVVLLLSPTTLPASAHLRYVAAIAKLFRDRTARDAIVTCSEPEQFMRVLRETRS